MHGWGPVPEVSKAQGGGHLPRKPSNIYMPENIIFKIEKHNKKLIIFTKYYIILLFPAEYPIPESF